jgi:hypothetical protein
MLQSSKLFTVQRLILLVGTPTFHVDTRTHPRNSRQRFGQPHSAPVVISDDAEVCAFLLGSRQALICLQTYESV